MTLSKIIPLFLVVLAGCPIMPGSRLYEPLPQWERQYFETARRDVFPDDVRKSPDEYKDTLVVWTGIIKTISIDTEDNERVARFTIEHHYFDWIEDNGIQREKFFLSPRGEGMFALGWAIDPARYDQFMEDFAVGDMIIAYGNPSMIKDQLISFYPTFTIRPVKPQWYRTDILDYGRPGEPSKVLKTAF